MSGGLHEGVRCSALWRRRRQRLLLCCNCRAQHTALTQVVAAAQRLHQRGGLLRGHRRLQALLLLGVYLLQVGLKLVWRRGRGGGGRAGGTDRAGQRWVLRGWGPCPLHSFPAPTRPTTHKHAHNAAAATPASSAHPLTSGVGGGRGGGELVQALGQRVLPDVDHRHNVADGAPEACRAGVGGRVGGRTGRKRGLIECSKCPAAPPPGPGCPLHAS